MGFMGIERVASIM
uniref:Uncharacterized protein n=1 Tax=Rhizophora mucronata TaxID=61149 RepID=A0A2P2PY00_RHIMU